MKIRYTVTWTETVHDLYHYDAATLEEAAANTKEWIIDGTHSLAEALSYADKDLVFDVTVDEESENK